MCEHEGQDCLGRGCRCDCMDCPGHGSKDDAEPEYPAPLTHQDRWGEYDEGGEYDEDPIYLSALYSSEMENPL